MGFGALAMCLRARFTSPKILLMTILCQGIRNRKPKAIPKPEAKPAPKPAPKGKHMQLFKMRHKVGKGFYSTASDAPDGQ
jgi:hypothetical protein